jgi:uncharacterized protein
MLLTDDLLLNYKRCQRRAFLNVYGNSLEKDRENEFLWKLREENNRQIALFLDRLPEFYEPKSPISDWLNRSRQTEALMQRGVDYIYNGILLNCGFQDWMLPLENLAGDRINLVGVPTLLIKREGESKFGNWLYQPASIKLGRNPKPEYKIIAAFHAQLLASIQEVMPESALLILRQQNQYEVNLQHWLDRMREMVSNSIDMLLKRKEPEVFISRQRCSLCHWYSHCYNIAQSQQHLSLVPGVTPTRYEQLIALGLATIESIAAACASNMGESIGMEIASQLKLQAQSLLDNRAILKNSNDRSNPIPTAKKELYFDIEAEPERNLDYLLGVLLVDRQANTEEFYAFLAEKPEDEGKIWEHFLALVELYADAPIFHFSEYEVETIKRLAQLYETPKHKVEVLLPRFVDLHKQVVSSVTLPVESYSLKSIANWLGFEWRERGVSGEQSVCWYDRWLKTGDRTSLESILRYNEDDCRATYHLKEWLVEFLSR